MCRNPSTLVDYQDIKVIDRIFRERLKQHDPGLWASGCVLATISSGCPTNLSTGPSPSYRSPFTDLG
jgi:hypothetical protein